MLPSDISEKVLRARIQFEARTTNLAETQIKLAHKNLELIAVEEAQAFLQGKAQELQQDLKFRLEDVVNAALDTVFPGAYRFEIRFEIRRGNSEVDFILVDLVTGGERDIMRANGGGLGDIVGFCLRVATMLIARVRRILVMDEAMKFVSPGLKKPAYEIMEMLIRKFDIQVLANTHDVDDMRRIADREFQIERINGVSQVVVV